MSEPLDPTKYHVLSSQSKKRLLLVAALVLLLGLPPLLYKYYRLALFRPNQISKEITLEVKKGQSVPDIARDLYGVGVINSEFLFNFYVYTNRFDNNIQAGTYTFPAGISLIDVVKNLQHGKDDKNITFLEGWRTEEYIKALVANFNNIDQQKFFLMAKPYEGYLFPDTYTLNRDVQEEDVLNTLRATFDTKTQTILTEENLKRAGLTREEAVIFASLVEREVRDDADKPIVAGILIKRWREGMKLDVDATTQYVVASENVCNIVDASFATNEACAPTVQELDEINWWPKDLSVADLAINSPYNTRKSVGLPPTPISNPGLNSIEAVINYTPSPYYFYLTDPEGNTHFSRTLEEHTRNIFQYLSN